MSHFAELNNENIVLRVVVICNEDCLNSEGIEYEQTGIDTCKRLFGQDTRWVQTSYTGRIRKIFAGIGDTYDEVNNEFVTPYRPSALDIAEKETNDYKEDGTGI